MSEFLINPARTCAVTGHRAVDKTLNIDNLKEIFNKIINTGYNTFLIGMAIGFDTICFRVLYELKQKYDIKLIACIPCENQDLKYNFKQKEIYRDMLEKADEKIYIRKEYSSTCMQKRNEFMVDNSSCLVAYLRRNFGGTYKTVEYAKKKNVVTIEI